MLSQNEEELRQELLRLSKLFECPICLNLMTDPMVTRCVHRFCAQCINKSIETSSSDFCRCPLCNEKITKRGLRKQEDINDIVQALIKAVNSFENDCQKKVITNAKDVVIFDISVDKSKSIHQIDFSATETIDETEEIKLDDQTNHSIAENNGTESEDNRKTTTITCVMNSQYQSNIDQTIETIDGDQSQDNNATDIYFETSKNSINGQIGDSLVDSAQNDSISVEEDIIATQSQNLKVNKSKITYGCSRRSHIDDKFDRVIGIIGSESDHTRDRSELNSEQITFKSLDSVSESETPIETNEKISRKPLNHLNKNENQINDQKDKLRKMQSNELSDDQSSPVIINSKRKIPKITDSSQDSQENGSVKSAKVEQEIQISDDDMSEDLFLPAIDDKDVSNEAIRNDNSPEAESNNGYHSDTQLIPSSPFTSDLF